MEWDQDPVFLASIELISDVQGRGLGTRLIRNVLEQASHAGKGVCLQVLKTNAGAQRLYLRLGFRMTASNDTHIMMSWVPGQGPLTGV